MRTGAILALPQLLIQELLELVRDRRLRNRLLKESERLHLGKWVEIRSPHRLQLGKDVMIDSGVLLHCGGMDWSNGEGGISIGDHCYIGPNAVLFGGGGIEIGAHSGIGPGVVIASHQNTFARPDEYILDQPSRFAPVVIEENVMITSNATILPGVRIGTGSVIGAGAVLTKDVPPRTLWMGVPARKIRDL